MCKNIWYGTNASLIINESEENDNKFKEEAMMSEENESSFGTDYKILYLYGGGQEKDDNKFPDFIVKNIKNGECVRMNHLIIVSCESRY